MKTRISFLFFISLFFVKISFSQVIGISETAFTPDSSAILHLNSPSKGLLVPRMTEAQRDAIYDPATGLIIFQIDVEPFFYYFDGVVWQKMCCTTIYCLLEAQITTTQLLCFGDSNGIAKAIPTNGTSPFSYIWSNGVTTDSISNLPAGTYTVTITDSLLCTASTSVTITSPPELSVFAGSNSPVDEGNNINLSSNGGGGTSPYDYNWTGPDSWTSTDQNPVIANAQTTHSGTYTVTITDENGCTATAQTSVTVSSASPPDDPVVIAGNCGSMFDSCEWYFTINDVGATYYEMKIETGGGWLSACGSPWATTGIITPIPAGSYEYCTLLASHGHSCTWPGSNGWLCCVWIRSCNSIGCSAWVAITGNCVSSTSCNYVETGCITNL